MLTEDPIKGYKPNSQLLMSYMCKPLSEGSGFRLSSECASVLCLTNSFKDVTDVSKSSKLSVVTHHVLIFSLCLHRLLCSRVKAANVIGNVRCMRPFLVCDVQIKTFCTFYT